MFSIIIMFYVFIFFFFKQKTAYEMRISDWSSDVCSSDLIRHADLATNAKRSRLHRVDLATGADQELRTSPWFSRLQAIPGSDDWSVMADLGEGVQLYRVEGTRSAERREGKECGSTGKSRWSADNSKKKKHKKYKHKNKKKI